MLVKDILDAGTGLTVQALIEALEEKGCVDLETAFFYDYVEIQFERPETEAEKSKRLAKSKKAKSVAEAKRKKKEDEEYAMYLELAKKYGT
jgi:hypothetical protein